jgi:hypothetical protein
MTDKEIERKIDQMVNDPKVHEELRKRVAQAEKESKHLAESMRITPEIWHRVIANI